MESDGVDGIIDSHHPSDTLKGSDGIDGVDGIRWC